jgi:hypothetical protein
MDATTPRVSLDRSSDCSSDTSSSDESGDAITRKAPAIRPARSTNLIKPDEVRASSIDANPAPDFVDRLFKAGKLGDSKKSQRLKEQIAAGTLDRLFICAETNDVEGLRKLIEAGATNLHVPRTDDLRTPLMIAAVKGHIDVVKLLIAHARPKQLQLRDLSGASALDLALDNASTEIALLLFNAAPGITDNRGYTPLVAAIADDKENRIGRLLKFLPNVNKQSKDGTTALEIAIEKGRYKLANKLLEKGAFVNEKDLARNDPLSIAARFGYADIVSLLIDKGAVVDRQNKNGNTALQFAAWQGHRLVMERLLQHGAKPDIQDQAGITALFAAASSGHANIIRQLLAAHASVDLADVEGHTPLHVAALLGHVSAVEELLKQAADATAVDKHGRTPLQYAVEKNHVACVRKLMEHGADINHVDEAGHTALDICDKHGWHKEELGDVLREYGARGRCCKPCVII